MYVPALAARAPLGPTNTATGTREARIALMITRIDVSSPPGVSICSTTSCAPSLSARSSPRVTNSAVAGPIAPVNGSTITVGGSARTAAAANESDAKASNQSSFTVFTRNASRNQVWDVIIAENRTDCALQPNTGVAEVTPPARRAPERASPQRAAVAAARYHRGRPA